MKPEILNMLSILESEPNNADALAALTAAIEGGGNGKSDPAAVRAFDGARRANRDRGDFELVMRLCDLELSFQKDGARRAELLVEKGRILADEMWRADEARHCWEQALEAHADDEAASEALSQLELVRENWSKIAKKYKEEIKSSTDRQLTVSLHVSLAEVYAKHDPGSSEIDAQLKRALELDPRNKKAGQHLERVLRGAERWDDLRALYVQRVDAAGSKEERIAALGALADLEQNGMGRPELAVATLQKLLALDPLNPRALSHLADVYTGEQNWQGLLKLYEGALKARPRGDAETGILIQLAMVLWRKLGNAAGAEEQFRKVRQKEPANPLAVEFYRWFYGEKGESQKLLQVLQQAQKAEPDEKRRLTLAVEMARVAESSAGSVEKAIDIWKSVFKLDKTNADAVASLKRLYQKTEKWNALLEILKEQIDAIPKDEAHVGERIERLQDVVAIYRDKLNLDVMVINTFNTILSLKPDHEPTLAALAAKYEAMGRWNDLIGVLQRQADATQATAPKAKLLRRIAGLWIEKFGNHNQAVKPLEELYAIEPTDGEVVARLRDIYLKRRSWRALLDLERKELEQLDGAERRQKLVDMAKLAAERLGDLREAIAIWNQLLSVDPSDPEALSALVQLYEREKRWPALIEVLGRQRAVGDPKQQLPLLEKIGNLWADKMQAPERAVATYQEILRVVPGHPKTVRLLRDLFAEARDYPRLEALYGESGQWDELCETLLAVAERVADVAEKLRLYQRVAEIAGEKLRQPERAAKAYERILSVEPNHLDAARSLVPIYRRGEKWARLLATYEILLGHAQSDDERLALHAEIRQLCEDKLGSKQLAFSWCARAVALRPDDAALAGELERLAREADAYDELVAIYAAQAKALAEGARKVARLRQVADLLLTKLNQPEEARRYYAEVLERQPGDAQALAALEQIHTHGGNWGELLAIYRQRVASTKEPGKRTELLFKIARIEEEKGNQLEAAAATYQQILVEEPSATRALRALERIYQAMHAWEPLAKVLQRQLELGDGNPETEAALAYQLGELHELKLHLPAAALPFYQRAFARQPQHKATLAALERYLADGNLARVDVARLLAPVYEKADEPARLAEVLGILLQAETDAGRRDAELALLRRLAALVGRRLGDVEAAFAHSLRIFELVPADADVRRELAELSDLLDNHGELCKRIAATEARVAEAGDKELARDLAWEQAGLLETRLHLPLDAEKAYRRVLGFDPSHDGALRALERMYQGAERWPELRALLVQRKELTLAADARRELLFRIADLDEGVLGDAVAAARTYEEVLDVDAGSQRAFRALDRLYAAREQWRELDGLLGRWQPYAESNAERAQLGTRRGELHAQRLDDHGGACQLFEEALAEDPRNEGARKGLEKLITLPALRQRIARVLEPLYASDENWPRLVMTLQAQREAADGRDAVALLSRIALLVEEKLGSRQQAFAVWREALLLDPTDESVRDQVERLAILLERFAELAEAWEQAEKKSDPNDLALRASYLAKAAELYDDELRDADKARSAWRRLLDLDPDNLETARPAARALERLYQAEESWPHLIDMLRRQAEWAGEIDAKKELLRRVGTIHEDMTQDFTLAVAVHREILDLDPEDLGALDALERLHGALDEWSELVGVLRRRVALSTMGNQRRDLLWRIAQLTEQKLGLPAGSPEVIASYTEVLDETPEDVPALDALARLYEVASRPGELLDVLERRLGIEPDMMARVRLRGRIAALLEGPLARLPEALDRYREMLLDDPDNEAARQGLERMLDDSELRLRAAEVLEPIYEGHGDGAALVKLCELWAAHAPDLRDRVARLRRAAVLQQREGAIAKAFDALARAARLAVAEPELQQLLDALDQAAQRGHLKAELVALYQEIGADVMDTAVQERIYLTVASESRALGDRVTAREYFRRVLDTVPDHAKALDALELLYAEGQEWEPLLEIYNRRAELSADDEDRRRHYLGLAAELCAARLDRPAEAITCHEQILSMFPADEDSAKALDGLYAAGGRWADLADLLERRLGFADDIDQAVGLHYRLGQIYQKELSDADRAVENYRSALGGDPDHPPSIAALEAFLSDIDHRVDAAEVLEPVYASRHDWRSLIRIYEIRLDAADDPARRLSLTKRIARACEEQLEDLEAAFRWYGKVFREDPADRAIRDQLSRLAGILDCHAELAAVYEDFLQDTYDETPATLEVMRTLATLCDAKLGEVDRAKACYLRLLRHDPHDASAFSLLESLLTRAARWNDLLEVYREAADGTDDVARRKTLLYKICQIQEHRLKDTGAAIDSYRAVLEVDDEDAGAMAALDRLYGIAERWHDLVELLGRLLERAGGGERVGLKLRLGALFEQRLEDLGAAIDNYEEVLQLEPRNRDALAALERLVLSHEHRYRIAQILEPLYKAQDEWAKLVVIYDAELEFIDDKGHRVELLIEIARIHAQRGGDLKLAFGALARAWSEEAAEGESREAPLYQKLVEIAEALNAWVELVRTLEKPVEDTYDDDLKARVWARIAEIHEKRRGDLASAVAAWRKVVAVRDDDAVAWKALERLLAALGRPAELVEVLEKRADLSMELTEQKMLAYRAADLYERTLSDPEKAIATWRRVLSLDEDDRPALGSLARLYQGRGAWRDLTGVYQRQIELAATETERRPLRFAMARVFEESLRDAFEAITAYRGAVEANAKDLEAHEALARLYEKESQWPELLEALDAIAALRAPGPLRDEVRVRAAKVLEEKQNELEAAIDRYRLVLDDAPDNEPSRIALEALVRRDETRLAAASVLEPLYRARGDVAPLIDVLELRLLADPDPSEQRTLLASIAELHETGLDDLAQAFHAWGRLLAADATDDEAYQQLERLSQARAELAGGDRSAWSELAALYEQRLDAVFDPDAQRTLVLKLAVLYEVRLGNDDLAVSRYRKALELGGDELVPLASLDRLLAKLGRAADLAEVIERAAQAVPEPYGQAEYLYRLGELQRGALGAVEKALAAYRDALEREPRHPGARAALGALLADKQHATAALEILEPLYEADGDHARRVRLGEVRLGLLDEKSQRAAELQRIARIYEDDLRDPQGALEATVRALGEQPDDGVLADEVERLAGEDGMPLAAAAFDAVVEHGEVAQETARDLGLRAANLYRRLGEAERAEAHYRRVLSLDAENAEALEALEGLYRASLDAPKLVAILERRAELELDFELKKRQLAEVASLRQHELRDDAGAVGAWKKVLDSDETDAQALGALAQLHEAAGRFRELVEVLEQQARFADAAPAQAAIKSRIASLYADRIGDLDKAVDAYRDLLDVAPDSQEAMAKLEELHAQRNDWLAVQEMLVRRLSSLPAGPAQVPVYRRLAQLALERQNAPEDAIGYYQQILDLAPDDADAEHDLEALLGKLGKWYDLVDTLKTHADRYARRGRAAEEILCLVRAATVLEENLDSAEAATELLEQVLARDPRNTRALAALARIYESQKDLERCKATLERAVALGPTGSDLAELMFRLGSLEKQLSGDAGAMAYYQKALAAAPDYEPAAEALEKHARGRNDFVEVAKLVERRAERAKDAAARKPLLLELADLYGQKLGRANDALGALERARALAPDDATILEPLADAYFNAGRLRDALPVYQGLLDKIGKGRRTKEVARLHYRLGAIAEKEGQGDLASQQYQLAYQIDAGHAPTLSALGRLYVAQSDWEKARRIYRSMLLQNLDPAAGVSKADVYLQLGLIHEKLSEASKAVGMYERGLEIEPQHAVLKEALSRARAAR